NLYIAFRKDAMFVSIGPGALTTIKEAVASAQAGTGPVVLFDFNVARMASTFAKTAEQKEAARKLTAAGKDATVRAVIDAGDTLTLRLHVSLDVLEFFAKLNAGKGAK